MISLINEKQRRSHIVREFTQKNVEFDFFDAIDCSQIHEQLEKLQLSKVPTELRPAEIACLLSHLILIQKCVDENLDYICIFEDDIHLSKDIKQVLEHGFQQYHIVKLEAFYPKVIVKKAAQSYMGHHALHRLCSKHLGCGGYIVSQAGALIILEQIRKAEKLIPIDHFIFNYFVQEQRLEVSQILPAVCIQDHILMHNHENFPSALEAQRRERKNYQPKQSTKKTLWTKIKNETYRLQEKITLYVLGKKKVTVKFK